MKVKHEARQSISTTLDQVPAGSGGDSGPQVLPHNVYTPSSLMFVIALMCTPVTLL